MKIVLLTILFVFIPVVLCTDYEIVQRFEKAGQALLDARRHPGVTPKEVRGRSIFKRITL